MSARSNFGSRASINRKKRSVDAPRKALDIENRMIRLRQLVQRQHADHGKDGGAKNGQFERDRNERRPTVQRAAANVDGITDGCSTSIAGQSRSDRRQSRQST